MGLEKRLNSLYLSLAHASDENRESIITVSILMYVGVYLLMSLGGLSFQVQPAVAYSVEIDGLNFDKSSQGHKFLVNATVSDGDGDDDIQSCDLEADNGSNVFSDSMNIIRSFGNENQSLCQYNLAYKDPVQDWGHLDSINALITAEDNADDTSDSMSGSSSFPNHGPVFTKVSYSNYSQIHGFNVTAEIYDPDANSSSEITKPCWFRFSDNDGNSVLKKGNIDYAFGSNKEAACTYSNVNSSMPYPGGKPRGSGLEVLETVDVWANVSDRHGSETTVTGSNTIPNSRPFSFSPQPEDEGTTSEFPVEVSAGVKDTEADKLNVTVFNEDTNEMLYREESITSGKTFSFEWSVPDATTSRYRWTVQTSDAWSSRNITYEFRKTLETTYRTDLSVTLNYSTIVMNEGNSRYVDLKIKNNVPNEKNLTVNLTGVDAEFLDGKTVKNLPNFGGGESRTYTLRVLPSSPVDGKVIVTVRNNDLGIETVEKIPVTVLPTSVESNEVPGVGLLQIIFLISAATVLYSVQL